jgi:hypothetical protein
VCTKENIFGFKKTKIKMAYMSTPEMEQLIKQVQVLDLGKVSLHGEFFTKTKRFLDLGSST